MFLINLVFAAFYVCRLRTFTDIRGHYVLLMFYTTFKMFYNEKAYIFNYL